VLRRFDVNIETLDTTLEAAPITGSPTFAMSIVLSVPPDVPIADVERDLAEVCESLDLDWRLEAEQ
jgi:glycine cleavage system regulatory protein